MSLEKELEGVTAPDVESPADVTDEAAIGGADDQETQLEDAPAGEKAERPIENVRRELLRKQDELKGEVLAQINQLGELFKATLTRDTGKKPAQTLDDLSIDELRAMRGQVPDEKKAEFDAYFEDRRITEAVNQRISQRTEVDKYESERKRANQMAVDFYPKLKDRASAFHQEVNRRLANLDPQMVKFNPRIVLNLADDVASEMGIARRQSTRARQVNTPSSINGNKPSKTVQEMTGVINSDEEYEQIAKRLKHAAPKGGFNKERIQQRSQAYQGQVPGMKKGN